MELKFIPIDYDYFDWQGKNYVRIVGRDNQGKRICVVDDYEPNFWAVLTDGLSEKKINSLIEKVEKIKAGNGVRESNVEKVELHDKNFLGKKVKALKIFVSNHKDMHAVADKLGVSEIEKRREYDLSLVSKYIMEKKLEPMNWYDIQGEIIKDREFGSIENLDADVCIKAEKISLSKKQEIFEPKVLAYDIEVDEFELGKGNILMISIYGRNFKKVLTWKKCSKSQDFVECFSDEADMLEAFVKYVRDYSPDFLVGYFSDGFDLPYLRARAEKNKVKLSLGLDDAAPVFARGRIPSGKISGIVHVDLFRFIQSVYSQYLQSETLGLGDVAEELLGEGKLDFDFKKLNKMKDNDWFDFFEYNIKDSVITYKLAEKIWPDMLEFVQIMKEPLFNVSRDSMSQHVENYILHNLEKYDEIAERRPTHDNIGERRAMGKYEGAFVFQPTPGLYEDIVMFDFTSMYASVIVSYNLSLSTFIEDGKKDKKGRKIIEFSKKKGFFPAMLEEIIKLRKKYKTEYNNDKNNLKKARSNAYKLLANAAYGYQGFFGARYYCREAAAATAAFAKKNILTAIDKIKKKGYKIIYSDTDSIAFLKNGRTRKEILEFLKKLNSGLPGIMELDLEDFYKRGLFVSKRTTEAGAKKKYALVSEDGKFKIRGFETVRRDWCNLARELQSRILESVLKNGNEKDALKILKNVIDKIKNREVNRADLTIRTQLKKQISEYLAEGPHVVAAKKMDARGLPVSVGMLVEYFIAETTGKGKRIGDKVKLPDEDAKYDIDYYLNNQILPAVENIFDVFGVKVKEIVKGYKQRGLGEF